MLLLIIIREKNKNKNTKKKKNDRKVPVFNPHRRYHCRRCQKRQQQKRNGIWRCHEHQTPFSCLTGIASRYGKVCGIGNGLDQGEKEKKKGYCDFFSVISKIRIQSLTLFTMSFFVAKNIYHKISCQYRHYFIAHVSMHLQFFFGHLNFWW